MTPRPVPTPASPRQGGNQQHPAWLPSARFDHVAVKPVLTISVPGHPPSLNARLHYMARYRQSKQFKDWTAGHARAFWRNAPPLRHARLQATLCYARRPFRDLDNSMAALKPIIDGLVAGGVVVDDSPEHVEWLPILQELHHSRMVIVDVFAAEEEVEG